MKKTLFAVLCVLFVFNVFAADVSDSDHGVTGTAVTGVGMNASMLATVVGKIPVAPVDSNSSYGVSGLSFRFLNSKMEGFEIPVNFSFVSNGSDSGTQISGSLSLGYRLIFVPYRNDFMNFNLIPGLTVAYSYFNSQNDLYHSFIVAPSVSGEIEVSVGKAFGIPAQALKIATGFGVFGLYQYNRNYSYGVFHDSSYRISFNTSTFGSVLTAISIRYYL